MSLGECASDGLHYLCSISRGTAFTRKRWEPWVWVLETEVWSLHVGRARKSNARRKENLMPPTTEEGTLICQRTQH